jgi:ankyrin repeat protein
MLKKLLKTRYTDETFKKLLTTKPLNLKKVRRALHTNISINHKDNDNATYLHYCLKNNLTSSAKCLISEGININISDFENITAMYLAIIKGNKDIAKSLIDTNNLNTSILKDRAFS